MTFQGRKTYLKIIAQDLLKSVILSAVLAILMAPIHAISATAPAARGTLNVESAQALASASDDASYAVRWVLATHDNQGMPFIIVDKKHARIFVFENKGHLLGTSPALLGLSLGDTDVSDIVQRQPDGLGKAERVTPSGRFLSEPGRNLNGEAVIWIDYAARLAIHRLRPAAAHERRAARLASATPDDNRISLGCVIVSESFYDAVINPAFSRSRGVVYVLPETRPVQHMFNALHASLQ
jgi:hypothetical protein